MGLFNHGLVYMGDTEFVYPGCWHYFDNGAIRKFDDVLLEHGGLPHVLPLAVQLDHSKIFLLFEFCCGAPPSCLKVMGGGGWWWWPGAI